MTSNGSAVESMDEVQKATCRKCSCPIEFIGGAWVVMDTGSSGDGLSYCPPDPDAARVGDHQPRFTRKGRVSA